VVDINDNGIVLEKNVYYARVSELAPRGHLVAVIGAYDPDSVDQIKYSIVGYSHHHTPFDIHTTTGKKNILSTTDLYVIL
jgi:hypothetical protein